MPVSAAPRYTFHGTNGQALAINITGSTIADSLLFFYRPDGGEYTAFEFEPGNTGNGISLDTTWTWTVEVDPNGADTGSLNLKLS